MFIQAEEFSWLKLGILESFGASSLNEHLKDHESAMGRVLLMFFFHLAAASLDVRVSQAFVVERRNGKQRSTVGPRALTIAF